MIETKPIITIELLPSYVPSEKEEYMSSYQLEYFKLKLLKLKDELLEELQAAMRHLREGEGHEADPNDRAARQAESNTELRTSDRARKLIGKIDEALQRIEDGTYGYCIETHEPIGLKRLMARPVASLCIERQEEHERREKSYRDEDFEDQNNYAKII